MNKNMFFTILLFVAVWLLPSSGAAEIQIKQKENIAFLGDSITYQGNNLNIGYINLLYSALNANGIKAGRIASGINGSRVADMQRRFERDILRRKPQHLILNCGIYDSLQGGNRKAVLEQYKKTVRQIVEKAQQGGMKVYILTATMISENLNNVNNKRLIPYNDFLRQLAKEKKCVLVDLNQNMQTRLNEIRKLYPRARGNLLTTDGINMNPMGHMMVALSLLKTFGLTDDQIAKASDDWMRRRYTFYPAVTVSLKEYLRLSEKAFAAGMDVAAYMNKLLRDDLRK